MICGCGAQSMQFLCVLLFRASSYTLVVLAVLNGRIVYVDIMLAHYIGLKEKYVVNIVIKR